MKRTLLALTLLGGCALATGELRPPDAAIIGEYAAVRAGAATRRSDPAYRFVRDGNAVKATAVWPRVVDEEEYVFADDLIADNVTARLHADATLAGASIDARVVNRVVYLRGRASDAVGAQAIYDALSFPAVSAVYAELDRPVASR
jgi:BON domain